MNKRPSFDRLTTRELFRAADQYRRLSAYYDPQDHPNYFRYYCQAVGELVKRGLWARYERRTLRLKRLKESKDGRDSINIPTR